VCEGLSYCFFARHFIPATLRFSDEYRFKKNPAAQPGRILNGSSFHLTAFMDACQKTHQNEKDNNSFGFLSFIIFTCCPELRQVGASGANRK
jgi:hypothetical protein